MKENHMPTEVTSGPARFEIEHGDGYANLTIHFGENFQLELTAGPTGGSCGTLWGDGEGFRGNQEFAFAELDPDVHERCAAWIKAIADAHPVIIRSVP
jgi:hypothetical protein